MPVFIVGFARSGTTLCQRLVAERLHLPTLPETHFFERLGHHLPAGRRNLSPEGARALLDELSPYLDIDLSHHAELLAQSKVSARSLFLRLVEEQIGSAAVVRQGHWLEKTPMHVLHMPLILSLFPKARFIAMVRNPLTAFASRRELSEPGKGWGEDWKPIEVYCQEWQHMLDCINGFQDQHPEALYRLRLEDLSTHPDESLQTLALFLGRRASDAAHSQPLNTRIVQPFETWKQAAMGAVEAGVAERAGRSQLDDHERWRVGQLLAEPMARLGYAAPDVAEPVMDPLHRRLLASVDWYRRALHPEAAPPGSS